MRKHLVFSVCVIMILITLSVWTGCFVPFGASGVRKSSSAPEEQVVVMTTTKGEIVIALYPDAAPETVDNFKKLITKRFYDRLKFHRKTDWGIIQGGDPKGDGTGGPGYTIIDEYTNPNQVPHLRGTVAMARPNAPDSAGSQFYICLKAQPHLNGQYTTFGQVIQGMEVVDQLVVGDIMTTVRLEAKSKHVKPQ